MIESGGDALIVAVIALVVSVAAALFTGWQAVTAHLTRTTPRRASFVLVEPRRPHEAWSLLNSGGSIATRVVVTFSYPLAKTVAGRVHVHQAAGPIAPGTSSPLKETEGRAFVRRPYRQMADGSGMYEPIPAGGETRNAKYPLARHASVSWDDHKGRPRKGRMRLPSESAGGK
jgi:hypothetical protein